MAWKGRGKQFTSQFRKEILLYACHQYPYNLWVQDENQPHAVRHWWRGILTLDEPLPSESHGGQILPVRERSKLPLCIVMAYTSC